VYRSYQSRASQFQTFTALPERPEHLPLASWRDSKCHPQKAALHTSPQPASPALLRAASHEGPNTAPPHGRLPTAHRRQSSNPSQPLSEILCHPAGLSRAPLKSSGCQIGSFLPGSAWDLGE